MADKKIINPQAIECEVTDLDGKKKILTAKCISRKNIKDYVEAMAKADMAPIEDQVSLQMEWIFGGTVEDYDNYDVRTLRAAVTYFNDQMKNPT